MSTVQLAYSPKLINQAGNLRIAAISLSHFSIGIGIVAIATFIPAQLTFLGWNPSIFPFLLGIATIFESFRLIVGYFGDRISIFGSFRRNYVVIGLIGQIIGLLMISQLLGSILIIFGMIMFTMGSAMMATMADIYLIDATMPDSRSKVGAILQMLRLSGFAIGGIFGLIYFGPLGFVNFFIAIALLSVVAGVISVLAISESKVDYKNIKKNLPSFSLQNSLNFIIEEHKKLSVLGMTVFLILFPIGAFAQDGILESFAIIHHNYTAQTVGRLAAVWGTSTLIFIPLALIIERMIGRIRTITLGSTISGLSFLAIILAPTPNLFLIAILVFGIGLGILTTPSTALLLEVTSRSRSRTFLLAFFGLVTTFSRSISSFLASIIMQLSNNTFELVFIIEMIFLIVSFIPLIWVINSLEKSDQNWTDSVSQ